MIIIVLCNFEIFFPFSLIKYHGLKNWKLEEQKFDTEKEREVMIVVFWFWFAKEINSFDSMDIDVEKICLCTDEIL